MKKPNNTPTEYEECIVFADWLRANNILFTHLAQETFTRSWGIKMKNKRMGVNPGFPDYCVVIENFVLFVEMKRTKGSVISEEQKTWIAELNKCRNVEARACKGADEAIAFVKEVWNT